MNIEPTGVVFIDVCSIQTENCVAQEPAPITAVWSVPGRVQVNVCRPCLEEQIRSGEWEVQGAKIEKRVDVAVYSPDNKLQLVVEVKKKPSARVPKNWAALIHRNLLAHSGIPNTPYFLLAVPPEYLFLWKKSDPTNYERMPDYKIEAKKFFEKYADKLPPSPRVTSEYFYLEQLVSSWLEDLVKSNPSPNDPSYKWLYESGLYEAIKDGSVVMQARVAA
jgi:hypothetical protein